MWNHRTGAVEKWKADGTREALDPAEAVRFAARAAAAAAQREREQAAREAQGAAQAARLWAAASPARASHAYLRAKQISPEGLRETSDGRLLVPLFAGGKMVNVQTITADGRKRPIFGARKVGAHFVVGEIEPGKPVAFAEGLATAKSFHAATGIETVMALDTSNLAPVAEAFRKAYPAAPFVFAADNDAHLPLRAGDRTMPNVGVEKARAAAAKVGGTVLIAPEIAARTAADQGTDWNDVTAAQGRQAARDAVHAVLPERVHRHTQSRGPSMPM